jgi:prefoldin alpha subunit
LYNFFANPGTDEEIFVPLTSSLYVKGRLSNVEKLMVDIGTGYFAEKV